MTDTLTRQTFIAAAERGDWNFIDLNLCDEDITADDLCWAMSQKGNRESVRALATAYLMVSSDPLGSTEQQFLEEWLEQEGHPPTRYHLAIALFKRGNCHAIVINTWEEACHDADVGTLARGFRPKHRS